MDFLRCLVRYLKSEIKELRDQGKTLYYKNIILDCVQNSYHGTSTLPNIVITQNSLDRIGRGQPRCTWMN